MNHLIKAERVCPQEDYVYISVVMCVMHRNILCQHYSSCDMKHNFEEECEAIEKRKNGNV